MAVKKNRISQEEINTNKVMYTIMLSFLGEAILFFMYRHYLKPVAWNNYNKNGWIPSIIIGAVIFAATLIWYILWKKGKVQSKGVSWTPLNWLCAGIFTFAALVFIKLRQIVNPGQLSPSTASKYVAIAVLVFTILYTIFYFNKRAFFTYSVLSAVFGAVMYILTYILPKWYIPIYVISGIIVILSVLFIVLCKNNGGYIVFNKNKLVFFSPKSNYYFQFALIVFFIASVIAFAIYQKDPIFFNRNIAHISLYSIIAFDVILSIYSNYKNI